ncbi:MAG: UbiX family flavin prenyltransferase [Thermodesulfovibrionales bacterium]|nr:UbiX family flavin prenyltransferase [Thermodesulfovibrionales bacterium]
MIDIMTRNMNRYVICITGASGAGLGFRVLKEMIKGHEVHLVVSTQAFDILRHESGIEISGATPEEVCQKALGYTGPGELHCWDNRDLSAPIASGSFEVAGTLVVPCSMKSLAGIAAGYADNLTGRAADVAIKEGRPLLLAPREMPFSAIHLENMLKLARLGVVIAPPVPALYHQPKSIDELYDFLAGKVLDAMGIKHDLFTRWGATGTF